MKHTPAVVLSLIAMLAYAPLSHCAERLSDYQWQHRLLLIRAAGNEQPIRAALDANRDAIIERDLVWFLVGPDGIEGSASDTLGAGLLADILRTLGDTGGVVLIGKDGQVKARYPQLDLEAVFSRIDSMPMRKREMAKP
ncbi:DUF4174 domain-containing protein [Biformimicrobium ophioploci]|uniref:DUF4174 domain-containing protein n=1 Tax=Biformimicrobium ophioploci TaxID=3036711 RepID=A0ABQ6LZW8_9GAMM|nr:DUF4174 domain-containing protein [Microbulbifer sp. NKW57]GMG87643.1 DUF4174 domain-containing protein [Microbulbifer sp. NKW57]